MNQVMKLLARMYPSSWRERYGTEFDALLEDAKPSARGVIDLLFGVLKMQLTTWTPVKTIVGLSILGVLTSAALLFVLPAQFAARDRVLVAADGESAAVAAKSLIIDRGAFDRQSLASIIQERRLYPRDRDRLSQDVLVDKMRRNINIFALPTSSTSNTDTAAFEVQFEYSDPDVAKQVDERLIGLIMERNVQAAVSRKSHWKLSVLDPPAVTQWHEGPRSVRFACFGSLVGFLAGLLVTGLAKWRTATNTHS